MTPKTNQPPPLDVPLTECFPLTEAPKHWPVAAGGRRLHKHTAFRWVADGIAGVKLRAVRVPGVGLVTHAKWVAEFIVAVDAQRVAAGSSAPPPSRRRQKRAGTERKKQTAATLARYGLTADVNR